MSQKVQKILAEILTKEVKKNKINFVSDKIDEKKLDIEKIKTQKNSSNFEKDQNVKVSEEENIKIIIKIIRENISRFLIVSFYFLVSLIAIFKLAFVVISYVKVFFNGIFSI
jgi:hypothetical protein